MLFQQTSVILLRKHATTVFFLTKSEAPQFQEIIYQRKLISKVNKKDKTRKIWKENNRQTKRNIIESHKRE